MKTMRPRTAVIRAASKQNLVFVSSPVCLFRYVNRLSDLLFAAARYASTVDGKPERPWKKLPVAEEKPPNSTDTTGP